MALTVTERATRLIPLVADEFGVSVDELLGDRRFRRFVISRWALCYGLQQLGMSLSEIGEIVGRDHSTVLYGIRRIVASPETCTRVERLLNGTV